MARISGVDLPRNKKIEFALQYIYGIGPQKAKHILEAASVDSDIRVNKLSEEQIISIRNEISENYNVEGELRGEITRNIKTHFKMFLKLNMTNNYKIQYKLFKI